MSEMRCDVLLFAQLADAIGKSRLTIDLPKGATIADAIESMSKDHPVVQSMRDTLAVAVNERYCRDDHSLNDGDTIALIPPVSGG